MITFVTLFLGLVVGDQEVRVEPSAGIVRVELVLDGEPVASLRGEPWTGTVSFGETLAPHRLEALGFDASGEQVGSAVQWINVPRDPAEAQLSLDLDPEGRASTVSVSWTAVEHERPRSHRVELDGAAVEVDDIEHFPLPGYDPDRLHFLRVELDFDDEVTAVAAATLGGFYADSVNTELTAVVVEVARDRPVELDDLAGRFRVRGEPTDPVAVEKGEAEILLVRDTTAREELLSVYRALANRHARLGPEDTYLRTFWTTPQLSRAGGWNYLLHPRSAAFPLHRVDMVPAVLIAKHPPRSKGAVQHITGAVAVAGMAAVSGNRRRAVVTVLGEPGADTSFYEPAEIRGYLSAMDVDLHVWTTHPRSWEGESERRDWGEVRPVRAGWAFLRALETLVERLERQRVVWFAGRHLPQEIEIVDGAPFQRVGAAGDS